MDNSFFIMADKSTPIQLKRFHVCSWEFKNNSALMEFGFEIDMKNCPELDTLNLELYIPWLQNSGGLVDLYGKLKDPLNSKFIFNDSVQQTKYLDEDTHDAGVIHSFYGREELCFLPVNFTKDHVKNLLNMELELFSYNKIIPVNRPNIYIRFFLEPDISYISTRKMGISKSTIIYDIKINEKRNLPDHLAIELRKKDLCPILSCFCFNIIPNNHEPTFLDSSSLKNVRTLEYSSFKKYLGDKRVTDNNLVVVFNKKDTSESYSFFSIFYQERIGTGQFAFAVLINLLTGILLYLPNLREHTTIKFMSKEYLLQIPIEFYAAIGIGLATFFYFYGPIGINIIRITVNKLGRFK